MVPPRSRVHGVHPTSSRGTIAHGADERRRHPESHPPCGLLFVVVSGVGFDPFSHLTAPNVVLYRRIMLAFVAAKRRFTVHLRPEDVHDALCHDALGHDVELPSPTR